MALDALEIEWLKRLAARGDLPNLAVFMEGSAEYPVCSDGATLDGSVWPTFAFGANPGKHGRYWWLQWLAEEMRYVRSSHPAFDYRPFWAGLAEAGRRVTVIDLPYAPLVRHELVEQVVGWGVHDDVDQESWPGGKLAEIRRRYGDHPLRFDTVEPHSPRDLLRLAARMQRGVAMRARLLEALAGDPGRELVIVVFSEFHLAGHYLAEECEVVPGVTNLDLLARVTRPLDDAWPVILRAAGEEATVVLFALHGMRFQVDFSSTLGQVLALVMGRDPAAAIPRPDVLRRLRNAVPDSLHRTAWRLLPKGVRDARQAMLNRRGVLSKSDPLFRVAHDTHGAVRLNLRGREAGGVIGREDGNALLRRLEAVALGFRTRDGLAAFEGLWRPAEHLSGPRVDRLPDGLLLANRALPRLQEAFDGAGNRVVNVLEERRNGVHTGRGFCFTRPGNGIRLLPRAEVDGRDFAATAYAVLGVPPAAEFEGQPFAELGSVG